MSSDSNTTSIESAISQAVKLVAEFYKDENITDVLLEEVRESEDSKDWLITIGYSRPKHYTPKPVTEVFKLSVTPWERDYKVIAIEKATGTFKSMTIREGLTVHG